MEVLNQQQTVLTNAEVYSFVMEEKKAFSAFPKDQRPALALRTILYETLSYLLETPAPSQTEEQIKSFIGVMTPYKLTGAEILQLINLRPTTAVEVQLVVEECEERLTEDQVNEIVTIVKQHFPLDDKRKDVEANLEN